MTELTTRKKYALPIFMAPICTMLCAFIIRVVGPHQIYNINDVILDVSITIVYIVAGLCIGIVIFIYGLAWMENEDSVVNTK